MSERYNRKTTFVGCTAKKGLSTNIPVLQIFVYTFLLLGLYGLSHYNGILPTPLYLVDEKFDRDAFISERAYQDFKALKDFGPHATTTFTNEVRVANFLIKQIDAILASTNENQLIKKKVKTVVWKELYDKVTAKYIFVKIHAANNVSNSLLLNVHFDSNVLTPSKSSDNEVNCATMLEVLRIFSNKKSRPSNNIIFAFTQREIPVSDEWSSESKVMINLNSFGVGGKSLLIEGGADWLMDYYRKVPHPYAQVFTEEMNRYLFPWKKDFQAFRDKAGTVGLDLAFFNDLVEDVSFGSLQHIGDNLLSLVTDLANAPELANAGKKSKKSIYFDIFGFFLISYSETAGMTINYFVATLSLMISAYILYTLSKNEKKIVNIFFWTFGTMVTGWILSELFIIVVGIFCSSSLYSMSWYGNSWLIFLQFCAPSLALTLLLRLFVEDEGVNENVKRQINVICVRLIWSLFLLFGTFFNIRTTYVLMILLLFDSMAFFLIHLFKLQNSVRRWQTIYIISLFIPNFLILYSSLITVSLLVAMIGMTDGIRLTDHLVGIVSSTFTFLMTFSFNSLITSKQQIKNLVIFLSLVSDIGYIICFAPFTFPYINSPAPAKYWIMHTRRITHLETGHVFKRDYGYAVMNVDQRAWARINRYTKFLREAQTTYKYSWAIYYFYFLNGLPQLHPEYRFLYNDLSEFTLWIPAEEPSFHQDIKLTLLSKEISLPYIKYNLSLIGPDRMALYLIPRPPNVLVKTSLADRLPDNIWGNPQNHYYYLDNFQDSKSFLSVNSLTFTVEVHLYDYSKEKTIRIAVSGIYVHDDINNKTSGYVQFLKQFPNWADVTPWLGSFTVFFI